MSHKPESIVIWGFLYAFITLNKRKQKTSKNIQMVKMSWHRLTLYKISNPFVGTKFYSRRTKKKSNKKKTFFT